jgi:hypothetical protein
MEGHMSEDPASEFTPLNEDDGREEIQRAKDGFKDAGQSAGVVTEELEDAEGQNDG